MPANVLLLAIWTSVLLPLKFSAYILVALVIKYFLPPQGFGPDGKTRGGIIVSPTYTCTCKECVNIIGILV